MKDNLFAATREHIVAALAATVPHLANDLLARVEVTPTRDPAHGDMATNAAMIAAKPAGRKPQALGAALASRLIGVGGIVSAEVAGPGFVNLRLDEAMFREQVRVILARGEAYGTSDVGAGMRVNVEYVSANPTGPLHIGHCRGAVVGDALANLLARTGFAVTKEFYINDAGAQVAALAWAAYWRYLQAIGTTLTELRYAEAVPGGLQYRGDYLIPVGEALARAHGEALAGEGRGIADPAVWLDLVRDFTVSQMLDEIRNDLASLGVRQEVFSSERALLESGAADRAIETLRERGLIYEGVLEPPKGKTPEDWEPREQTLFRSSLFGDDVDRPLRKSDGTNTYFANDIAYHADKLARGADVLIDVLGADHGGYVSRMRAAVAAMSGKRARFEVVLCQIVHVLRGGEPVRMSKRAGTYVTLRDLIDEVGPDVVRFIMLTRKSDAQMEFDLDAALAQTRENPVFYVQYAHARCRSVLRAAGETAWLGAPGLASIGRGDSEDPAASAFLAEAPLDLLTEPAALGLIRRLSSFPRMVEGAALAREPHRIAFFLYELAGDFNTLWQQGKETAALRFLYADGPEETRARLALVAATATVVRAGLQILGVTPVEEMR